jgi:parvulin-like peptidyl-prolyl isomerase
MVGSGAQAAERGEEPVAARIDGVPVTMGEVARFRRQQLHAGQQPAENPSLDAVALEQLIRQRLVVGYLARTRQGAASEQIDAEVERLKTAVQRQQIDWREHLAEHYGDEESLRRYLTWRIGWSSYVRKQATEAALQKYFEAHRRDFDGTQIHVSQILWKAGPEDAAARQQALTTAAQVREQIVSGATSFADAVARHSQAPSRQQQGHLGFISRRGEMHEAFARAAFALEPGEISPPVSTPHGIHLIRATEIRPGDKTFDQVRSAVEEQFSLDNFNQIASAERKRASIEYSADAPRLDAASGQRIP